MRRQDFKIEVCTNSVESVRAALAGGADRIELCAGMPEGGTTPSYGEICLVRELMPAGMHVIVRPRGGDFLYREDELEVMYRDIEMARKLGVDGVVLGCLRSGRRRYEKINGCLRRNVGDVSPGFRYVP